MLEQPPPPDTRQLAVGVALEQVRPLDPGGGDLELDPVGKLRLPHVAAALADAALVALDELFGLLDPAPPPRPPLGVVDGLPDPLSVGLQQPGGEEAVLRHRPARRAQLGEGGSPLPNWVLGLSTICENRITVTVSSIEIDRV